MRSFNRWGLLLLISTVTACSTKPSAAQLVKELKTAASWTATAHMVGDEWLKASVPTAYTRQTLQTTQEEFHKEVETIAKVAPAQNQTAVQKQLQGIEQTLGQITKAVEQSDRPMLAQHLQQLSTQEQALDRLINATSDQP